MLHIFCPAVAGRLHCIGLQPQGFHLKIQRLLLVLGSQLPDFLTHLMTQSWTQAQAVMCCVWLHRGGNVPVVLYYIILRDFIQSLGITVGAIICHTDIHPKMAALPFVFVQPDSITRFASVPVSCHACVTQFQREQQALISSGHQLGIASSAH